MAYSGPPILLVEDSPEDFEVVIRTLRKSGVANPIYRCLDGEDALDFLNQRGAYRQSERAPRPALILLDLNLPGTGGREVLMEIKQNPQLKNIPVVVLTTSGDERDIQRCYQEGASSYVQKPVDLSNFVKAIENLKQYWLGVVMLPSGGNSHPGEGQSNLNPL